MLYIFHVDTGTMMTFDMNLAMNSVANLQHVIMNACHIQEDKQVLLISGGESLDPAARVGSYSAGTDTNPIYLFSKSTIEAATPPSPSVHYGSDIDLQEQVEGSLIMPPTYETVVSRAQLALQFNEVDKEELRACERLVHDQHLQQQGWAAVVANLEDITSALKQRSVIFQDAYREYLGVREHFIALLGRITEVLELLSKIPVLQTLHSGSPQSTIPEEAALELLDADIEGVESQTLYAWINSQDPQNRLEDMCTQCLKVTEQFDEKILESLSGEVMQTFEAVTNQNMKEVKGLEDRLYGLDQIMSGANRVVQEQAEMSQGFVQNQNRAGNLRDTSVLPDLCASHKKQLLVMLNNHRKLREIKKKCRMAKEELSINLHTRLRWVMFVEKKICDVDGKLMIYHENLKRLRKRLDILQQIHDSPQVYAHLVVEVVRRKNFSSNFLQWARTLAEESSCIHSDEIKRREVFLMEVGQHFLQALFHGFEDIPPKFATECPEPFDHRLPNISSDDLKMLQQAVPQLAEQFSLPNELGVDLQQRLSSLGPWMGPSCHSLADSISPGRAGSKSHQLTPLCQSQTTCASDIDILQESNGEHHFSPIECEEISFNGEICAPGTEPVIKLGSASPQENIVFIMPESLSTKLTAEMKNQAEGSRQEETTLGDSSESTKAPGILSESRHAAVDKSSDDSTSSRKPHRGGGNLTSDTSPEVETSQDFTTADFYIDESLPSSIEHMPSSRGMDKSDISKQLQEKCESVIKLENDLRDSNTKLSTSETKMNTIQEFVKTEVQRLREMLSGIKEDFSLSKAYVAENISSFSDSLAEVLTSYDADMAAEHVREINSLQERLETVTSELNAKLTEANTVIENLRTEISNTREQLSSTKADSEASRLSLETKINELSKAYEAEREEIIRNHALETEVELDKLREEFNQQVVDKETEVKEICDDFARVQEKLSNAVIEKEKLSEELNEKFQKEKEEITLIMETDFEGKMKIALSDVRAKLAEEHETVIVDLTLNHCKQLEERLLAASIEKHAEILLVTDKAKEQLEQEKLCQLDALRAELQLEHGAAMTKMEESFTMAHVLDLEECKREFEMEKEALEAMLHQLKEQATAASSEVVSAVTQTDSEIDLSIPREKHEAILTDIQSNFEHMKAQAVVEALQLKQVEHDKQLADVRSQLERENQEKLNSLKASITAEKQVLFNEAVSKLTMEKEKLIEELRGREATLLSKQQKDKELLDQMTAEKNAAISEQQVFTEKMQHIGGKHRQLEDDLALSRQQFDQYRHQIQSMSSVSVMSIVSEYEMPSEMTPSDRLQELEGTLRIKEEEITKLNQKVMELSMTASTKSLTQDKVSITSCTIGDIVLLCLDERHDQYVVFTIGTTLHFLHSDCLEPLALKTNPGEPRKSWVLAEITEKEYCQAKKPQNRFKVPVGTKFYRVKAKPWSRESSRRVGPQGAVGGKSTKTLTQ